LSGRLPKKQNDAFILMRKSKMKFLHHHYISVLLCLMCLTALAFWKEAWLSSTGGPNFESVELVMGTGHDVFIPLETNGIIVFAAVQIRKGVRNLTKTSNIKFTSVHLIWLDLPVILIGLIIILCRG
jgi:hypothetical protein